MHANSLKEVTRIIEKRRYIFDENKNKKIVQEKEVMSND